MVVSSRSVSFYKADFHNCKTLFHNFRITEDCKAADFRGCHFGFTLFYQVDLGVARLGPANCHRRTNLSAVKFQATTMLDRTVGASSLSFPKQKKKRKPTLLINKCHPRGNTIVLAKDAFSGTCLWYLLTLACHHNGANMPWLF